MVWNIFMMHLCIVATLCFFKIISPRNYYYCDQDDFPWVYGSKYVSKSNCCQRLFVFYILDVKSFHTYRNINISNHYILILILVLFWMSKQQKLIIMWLLMILLERGWQLHKKIRKQLPFGLSPPSPDSFGQQPHY